MIVKVQRQADYKGDWLIYNQDRMWVWILTTEQIPLLMRNKIGEDLKAYFEVQRHPKGNSLIVLNRVAEQPW